MFSICLVEIQRDFHTYERKISKTNMLILVAHVQSHQPFSLFGIILFYCPLKPTVDANNCNIQPAMA